LRQEINAIREDGVGKQKESRDTNLGTEPVNPIRVEIVSSPNPPVEITEYYLGENNNRQSSWSRNKWKFELVGGVIALLLLVANIITLCEIRKQTPKIAESADAAKHAANTARDAFVVGSRPWVKISLGISKPITFNFHAPGGTIYTGEIGSELENVGQTVALHVLEWEDVIPMDAGGRTDTAQKRLTQYCDFHRHGTDGVPGYAIFPHDKLPGGSGFGDVMSRLDPYIIREKSILNGKIAFVLVGCVWYRSPLESASAPTHQTRFMYVLGVPVQSPFGEGPSQPYILPSGTADNLRIVSPPLMFSVD
jgi:hypothetical protein